MEEGHLHLCTQEVGIGTPVSGELCEAELALSEKCGGRQQARDPRGRTWGQHRGGFWSIV